MNKRFSLTIRTQLIILIFVMSLAPLGITIFSAVQKHNYDKQAAWLTAERLCNEVGNQQNILLSGVEQLLSSLAYIPIIQNRDAKAVSALFAQLAKKYPAITNILIADTTGRVWASALPMSGVIMANDRRYFRNVLATGNFSAGEYTVGRVLDKQALSFGYPIRDSAGEIKNIAIISFTLESFNQLLILKKMPDNTSLVLTDHKGTILFDTRAPKFIGEEDKEDIFKQMSEGPDKGTFEATGITGKHRYFAYQKLRLDNEQAPYLYVRTGILKENAVSSNLMLNVGIMGLFTFLAICFAVYTCKRGIVDKVIALRDAAEQVGNGNLSVQVSACVSGGEFGELGRTFDDMSQRLADNLSKREQTEKALLASKLLLEKTFESLNEAIFIVETGTRIIIDCNITCERMFGYPRAEMIGATTGFLHVSKEMSDCFGSEMLQAYTERGSFETVYRMKRMDGTVFDSEHLVTPVRNELGKIIKHICVVRDISVRVGLENDLAILAQTVEARNKFVESVITNLQSGIIVIDPDFRIKMVNSYVAELCGIAEELFVGRSLADLSTELYENIMAGKTADELLIHFCNNKINIGYNISHLIDAEGNIIDSILNFKDLTEVVGIRKELRQKERLSAMGEVVARVAHEMRNPLFGMTAAAQILEMELTLEANQQELMDSLLNESRRLNNLVEELLDTTRETRIIKKRVDLISLLDESVRTVEAKLIDQRVSLRRNYDGSVWVYADFEKLEQVIINLVKNAMEASRSGGYISLDVIAADRYVDVIVTDNGQGIPSENLDMIFEVFYTTKKNGTGMGLSICRNIVEAHGGSLIADNNPDGGAKFVMQLPVGEAPA